MAKYDFNEALKLGNPIQDYAKNLNDADRIRLAAFLLGLVNAVQQTAEISQDDLFHAKECTRLFDDVDQNDPAAPGYHLHNMLENLAEDFNELADGMDEVESEAIEQIHARALALAKLTNAEKQLLGLPV